MKGINEEDKAIRYTMLDFHMKEITTRMVASGLEDPVGFVIDTSDRYGSELAKFMMEKEGLDYHQHLNTCIDKREIPTLLLVLPFDIAKKVLQPTAPNAEQNMSQQRPPGVYWVICIARSGNTYVGLKLDINRTIGIKPGQHRI